MTLRIAATLCLAFVLATAAHADGAYVQLEAGPSFFDDSDVENNSLDIEYDTGVNVGGAAGYHFLDVLDQGLLDLRAEFGVAYHQGDVDRTGMFPADGDVEVIGLMANGYWDVDLGLPVTPFVGAGIGCGVVVVDVLTIAGRIDEDDAAFAWELMGGLTYHVTPAFSVDGGYRYFATANANIGGDDLDIATHEVVVALRYSF